MMRLIQFFSEVAAHGSFTRAADELAISQPTISKGILALEEEIGVRLFNRNTRGLTLTEDGLSFLPKAQALLESYEDLLARPGKKASPRGTIKVSCPQMLGSLHLIPMLRTFREHYPDIRVDVRFSDAIVDLVGEGIDVALRVGTLSDRRIIARKIGDIPRVVAGSRDYFLSHSRPRDPDDLAQHQCIVYRRFHPVGVWPLRKGNKPRPVRVHGGVWVDSILGLKSAVLAGLGLGLGARFIFEEHLFGDQLVLLLSDFLPSPLPLHVVYPESRHLPGRIRSFVDFLIHNLSQEPWLQPL